MHFIRTELTSLVVWHHVRVSIPILSRVIKENFWWPWMTLPGVTDDVRIDISMLFAYAFVRGLLMKYNDVIRVPLRAKVPEIFAKNDFWRYLFLQFLRCFEYNSKSYKDFNLKFCIPQEWYNISGTCRQFFDNYEYKIATFVYVQIVNVDISKFWN